MYAVNFLPACVYQNEEPLVSSARIFKGYIINLYTGLRIMITENQCKEPDKLIFLQQLRLPAKAHYYLQAPLAALAWFSAPVVLHTSPVTTEVKLMVSMYRN